MATTTDSGILYSRIRKISLSEFNPSRVTRESTNPFLQEHHYPASRQQWKRERPARPARPQAAQQLRGRYIQLQFHDKKSSVQETSDPEYQEPWEYCNIGGHHSKSAPSLNAKIEDTRGFTSSSPSSIGRRTSEPHYSNRPRSSALKIPEMVEKRESFAIAVGSNPIHFDDEVRYVNLSLGQESGLYSQSPSTRLTESVEKLQQIDEDENRDHYCLSLSPCDNETSSTKSLSVVTTGSDSPSPPSSRRLTQRRAKLTSPLAMEANAHLSATRTPPFNRTGSLEDFIGHETRHDVKRKTSEPSRVATSTSNAGKLSRPTFLKCDAGEEYGRFNASYMGSREVDCYTNCIDICAKKIIDPKSTLKSSDVCVYVSSERIRLAPPKTGPLFKSLAVSDILTVSKCSKNNRLVGIVLWKLKSVPVCHILRCQDQLVSDSLVEAITQAIESHSSDEDEFTPPDANQFTLSSEEDEEDSSTSCSMSSEDVPLSGMQSLQQSFTVVYIGSVKAAKQQTVNDVIQRALLELCPSQAKSVTMCLSASQVRLIDNTINKGALLAKHKAHRIKAVDISQVDHRHIGYIVKESNGQLAGHIFKCSSSKSVAFILSFLQQACQISYREEESTVQSDHSGTDSPSLMARLRSISVTQKMSSSVSSSPSFQSYLSSSVGPTSTILDFPQKKRDSVSPLATQASDSPEEDYARFPVTYVGSATLEGPFSPYAIILALDVFNREGIAGGMAAVRKNVISATISSLGINLTDKTHKLFVHRNYPRNQIVGCAVHPYNSSYFAFATTRPGFPDQLKVHVFSQVATSVSEIMESIEFWLQIGSSSVIFNS